LLANENEHSLSELTGDFIEIIGEILFTRMSTADKKAALVHAMSKKHSRNTRGKIIRGGLEHSSKYSLRGITYGIKFV